MSLQEVLKNYESKKRQREKNLQGLRVELEKGIEDVSIQALKLQNHKVNHIHKNQQAIEMKLRKQQDLVTDLRKNQELWASLYEQLNRALMQVGDLVHYAGYIEAEVGEIIGVGTIAKYLQDAQNAPSIHQVQRALAQAQQKQSELSENARIYQQIIEQDAKYDSVI